MMFEKLAKTIKANAQNYRSKTACSLLLAKLKREYARAGSYGVDAPLYRAAVAALQDRWQWLHGEEADRRFAGVQNAS